MRERARSRAFVVSTVLFLLASIGNVVPSTLSPKRSSHRTIQLGAVGASASELAAIGITATSADRTARIRNYRTEQAASAAVEHKHVAAALVGDRLAWRTTLDPEIEAIVTAGLLSTQVRQRSDALGLGPDELQRLLAPLKIESLLLKPQSRSRSVRVATASVGVIVLYMIIQTYGSLRLNGIIEEKSTRVVEVLLDTGPRLSWRSAFRGVQRR